MTKTTLILPLSALVLLATAAGLSGSWTFEAMTREGPLRAKLALSQQGTQLSATLWIDSHVLKGEGTTDGTRFEVLMAHSDGSGTGHSERLRLTGSLTGREIKGSFDNGTDRGSWTGRREQE